MSHADHNETISDEDLSDNDYMTIDQLQLITDAYVKSENSSVTPRIIWRPLIEEIFNDIPDVDLNKIDRILVANLGYIKNLALLLASTDDDMLGNLMTYNLKKFIYL